MQQIADTSGKVLDGLYKDTLGNIIVNNGLEYDKYMKERQRQESINNLRKQVQAHHELINNISTDLKEMKQLLFSLIEKNSSKGQ